jgi:hypothetical protein
MSERPFLFSDNSIFPFQLLIQIKNLILKFKLPSLPSPEPFLKILYLLLQLNHLIFLLIKQAHIIQPPTATLIIRIIKDNLSPQQPINLTLKK